jgi:predicted RNA binding protein YcfA (HicA-like mRNA interferase family)
LPAFVIATLRGGSRRWAWSFIARPPASHEIWHNPATNRYTTIPNHPGDMPEGTLRAILKQAGIEPDTFLQQK